MTLGNGASYTGVGVGLAAGPATPDNFRNIARYRTAARNGINPAYADLLKQDFPNKAALVARIADLVEV